MRGQKKVDPRSQYYRKILYVLLDWIYRRELVSQSVCQLDVHYIVSNCAGFRNFGNTCYLNSVLQALLGLQAFTTDVMNTRWVLGLLFLSIVAWRWGFLSLLSYIKLLGSHWYVCIINHLFIYLYMFRSAWNSLSSESKFIKFWMLRLLLKLVEGKSRNKPGLSAILSGIKGQLEFINPAFKGSKMQVYSKSILLSSVADLFHFDTDPDPDRRIRFVEKRIRIRPRIEKIQFFL